jgi:hypothetical protein
VDPVVHPLAQEREPHPEHKAGDEAQGYILAVVRARWRRRDLGRLDQRAGGDVGRGQGRDLGVQARELTRELIDLVGRHGLVGGPGRGDLEGRLGVLEVAPQLFDLARSPLEPARYVDTRRGFGT